MALLREVVDTFQMYNGYHDTLTGQASHVLYLANGTQIDWGYTDTTGKFLIYSFVIEADSWFWACWNDSARHQRECDWNVPTLFYLARIAGTYFDPVAVAVNDSAQGNSTGRLDPGETADIWFTIRNRAIHPLDSAYHISAKLVSLDTVVTVLDSVKSFPDVQRRSDIDNSSDRFLVRASSHAQAGDTIPLRLEVNFTDAGNSIMMSVEFEVVLGGDSVGVREGGVVRQGTAWLRPTVIGSVLFLPDRFGSSAAPPVLLDALGREVMVLRPGENDVRGIHAGTYFVKSDATGQVVKVVVQR